MKDRTERGEIPERRRPSGLKNNLILLVKGIILGASAILPGVSAGVLTVTFGLYQDLIAFLAQPFRNVTYNLRLFVPLGIGWSAGFLIFAKLIALFFSASEQLAICLFIGLILGTLPELFEEAGKEGYGKFCWSCFAVSMVLVFGLLRFFESLGQTTVTPNLFWYFICGVLWGVSLVIPGMTFSSLLIFLGLYEPLNSGLASMNMSVLLPMVAGTLAVVLLLAKLIHHLFQKNKAAALHTVLGVTFASTMAIVPMSYGSMLEAVWCLALLLIGFTAVRIAGRFGFSG